jgi:nicotinate-nucleotide pyrophosphorylase
LLSAHETDNAYSFSLLFQFRLALRSVALAGRVPLEASGNINAFTLPAIAQTGVDFASVGAITCV